MKVSSAIGLPFILAGFISPSSALTNYIDANATIVYHSAHSCQIYGDPDLYGFGVRMAFYLQWFFGLIGVLSGLTEEFKPLRIGFNVLFLTLITILIRNTRDSALALFEWYLVTLLVLVQLPIVIPSEYLIHRFFVPEDEDEPSIPSAKITKPQPVEASGALGTIDKRESVSSSSEVHSGVDNSNLPAPTVGVQFQEHTVTSVDEHAERRKRYIAKHAKERHRAFLADAIGISILMILGVIYAASLPWVVFQNSDTGRKQGCEVHILIFGPVNLYNIHWQRFLKALAVVFVVAGTLLTVFAAWVFWDGLFNWRKRELALDALKSRQHGTVKALDRKVEEIKMLRKSVPNLAAEAAPQENGGSEQAVDPSIYLQVAARLVESANARDHARRQEATTEQEAMRIIDETKEEIRKNDQKVRYLMRWRVATAVVLFLIGATSIIFLEVTIRKLNRISLDDSIMESTGQTLSLLVAIFSVVTFSFDTFRGWWRERETTKEIQRRQDRILKIAHNALDRARRYRQHLEGRWKKLQGVAARVRRRGEPSGNRGGSVVEGGTAGGQSPNPTTAPQEGARTRVMAWMSAFSPRDNRSPSGSDDGHGGLSGMDRVIGIFPRIRSRQPTTDLETGETGERSQPRPPTSNV